MAETWKQISDYPRYEVSDAGRVRSVDLVLGSRLFVGRILRTFKDGKGYPSVNLTDRSRRARRTVHSLVAEAFIGPCPDGMETLHGDGTRNNAALSNLRYGTRAENYADSRVNGARRAA